MEASFISKHWLNNILQPKQICQEDVLIVENINLLEVFIQNQFTEHQELGVEYLAWAPTGDNIRYIIFNYYGVVRIQLRVENINQFTILGIKTNRNRMFTGVADTIFKKKGKELNIDDF